ncbi:HAMP domain-containing protein [Pseudomaricurvus alkylphenolicus]|uniref:ATP-binding protein n=1 Tax=Pseudomaricurvus alkylphenolicus TaxID=1306991 RepID=UPI00141E2C09|nr:ATP-binding protein [Pseudomaricurvus alkylphenolicus]NIB39473.1 HAMP domain-containing protein [Pseudomaricurvus alkylphenolicus]
MSIRTKLIVALLLAGSALIAGMVALVQWSIREGMVDYVNTRQQQHIEPLAQPLAELYRRHGGWHTLKGNQFLLQDYMRRYSSREDGGESRNHLRPGPRHRPPRGPDTGGQRPPHFQRQSQGRRPAGDSPHRPPPHRPPRIALYDASQTIVTGRLPLNEATLVPIELNGEIVGWFGIAKRQEITDGYELQFLQQQQKDLLLIAGLILLITSLLAIPLARHFLNPIRKLASAASELTQGEYRLSLPDGRSDELGALARDFNELARTLENNDKSRKRWMADVSHELRTPVSILRGELEALIDGIREATPETIDSIYQEILHLQRLINDLHELNASDLGSLNYRKQSLSLEELVVQICQKHSVLLSEKELELKWTLSETEEEFWGDRGRLQQLLDNLLSNCAKYCDQPGEIRVNLSQQDSLWRLKVEDSGPGVEESELEQIFDPLYRQDVARRRSDGANPVSTGLGLAICERIVLAHDGHIQALKSELGGLAIEVTLPRTA